jgi:hypothetical protein
MALAILPTTSACVFSHKPHLPYTVNTPLGENDFLILGFMGGRDSWNKDCNLRRLVLKLRSLGPAIHAETLENTKRAAALDLIRRAIDRNQNGTLDPRELASARLVLYGQSFGGAAVVKLAWQLKAIGVPVLLTVQIDSVGRGDKVIPSNVARAANMFQRNGRIIHGEPEIVAEDRAKTTIIGNFEFDYRQKKIDISMVPWHKKIFRVDHNKIEQDPDVWAKVEELILQVIKENS